MTFTEVFGASPRVKLLDFFADHLDFDYTISQLNEFTGISRPTLYDLIKELQDDSMVVRTRVVGDSNFYRLNTESSKVVFMLQADFGRINQDLEQMDNKQRANSPVPVISREGDVLGLRASPGGYSRVRHYGARKSALKRKTSRAKGGKVSSQGLKSSRKRFSHSSKRSQK